MKIVKKLIVYLVVPLVVLGIAFLFYKLFSFDKNENIDNTYVPDVTEKDALKLYNVLPTTSYNVSYTIYTGDYQTKSNTSYNTMGSMTINYIKNYDEFVLEAASQEEQNLIDNNILYKISKDIFLKNSKKILGSEVSFNPDNLEIGDNIRVKLLDNTYYVYETEPKETDFVYYKMYKSFTVLNNNKTIKIYDYYLRCNKTSGICYDTEKDEDVNKDITYKENLNILDYKNSLKQFEHLFEYEDDHYYWKSTQGV